MRFRVLRLGRQGPTGSPKRIKALKKSPVNRWRSCWSISSSEWLGSHWGQSEGLGQTYHSPPVLWPLVITEYFVREPRYHE